MPDVNCPECGVKMKRAKHYKVYVCKNSDCGKYVAVPKSIFDVTSDEPHR
ncbi:MAG: hypothetical protein PVF15_02820 [Candidatus Bathyarchaeota archaeon]